MNSVFSSQLALQRHSLGRFNARFAGLALLISLLSAGDVRAATLTNGDPAALNAAIQSGGVMRLEFDGTVLLTNTLTVVKDTTLDASGHIVILDGGNAVRHFVVTNGAALRLVDLTLANGRAMGRDRQENEPRGAGQGGSILNGGGSLELIGCTFSNNTALGGVAGPQDPPFRPGVSYDGGGAYGGAICSLRGAISATGCTFSKNGCVGGQGRIVILEGGIEAGGQGGDSFGGAVYATNSRVVLSAVVFTSNAAQGGERSGASRGVGGGSASGGAVALESGSAIEGNSITRCVFTANQTLAATKVIAFDALRTDSYGGALFFGGGSMLIQETLFTKNLAQGGPGWDHTGYPQYGHANGGAVYIAAGEMEIRDSAIVSNQACGGSLPPDWSGFRGGTSGYGSGGGVYNRGTLAVLNSTLAENAAHAGTRAGGAYFGVGSGGAILNEGEATLLNVTVADNSVEPALPADTPYLLLPARGSAACVLGGSMILTNSILFSAAGQTNGQTNVWGAVGDGGHNLCSDDSAKFTSPTSRNNLDPLLGPLGNNGGLTPTMPLLFGSPAIDAADAAACPSTDQRGISRPVGEGCDIGAFEFTPTLRLARQPGGTVTITYQFEAGQTNRISGSTNLMDWVSLGTGVTDAHGRFELADPESMGLPCAFTGSSPRIDPRKSNASSSTARAAGEGSGGRFQLSSREHRPQRPTA